MDNNIYKADLTHATKEKTYYSLAMFPYPSGAGLHVGHGTNFTANDVIARFKRMQWYTVINPIGWDSFGLPTENYAMKLGRSASEVTAENIANYKKQCELMDWSYDWDREVATSSPEYYKWTQWIFTQLFKAWLVYKKDSFVNRCPTDQTVLANDQVVDWCCERCGTEIIQKKHPQRFIKITDYAERLIEDLDTIDRPEETKTQQKYWIGKSEWAEIDFVVDSWSIVKKHYVVVHGYEWSVKWNWFPRIAQELQNAWHTVDLVELPNSKEPIVADQVQYVLDNCKFDENTVVIAHSLWCTIALKALEKTSITIDKCILVAWFLKWDMMQQPWSADYAEEKEFFDHMNKTFDRQYDLDAAKAHCKNFVVLHDKNDYAVQLSWAQDLAKKLDTKPIIFEAQETHACAKQEPFILEYALEKSAKITVFTTRPDTLFGVTAIVVAPEYASIDAYIPTEYKQAITDYRVATSKKTNIERQQDADTKSGVFSGIYAIHPLTQEKIQVRFADYVLPDYATGAVMFVPAHDERDWSFAKKHGLDIKQVINSEEYNADECYTTWGVLINSAQFDWLDNQEAKAAITSHLEQLGFGKKKTTFKLRDWSVSRQRYWGSPIPVYYTFDSEEQTNFLEYKTWNKVFQEWLPVVPRNVIQILVKDKNSDNYIFLKWAHDQDVSAFFGGIEGNETAIEAAARELREEGWFTDVTFIKEVCDYQLKFYHPTKNRNQYSICSCLLFEVDTNKITTRSDEDKDLHEVVSMTAEEFLSQSKNDTTIFAMNILLDKPQTISYSSIDRYNAYNPHPDKSTRIAHLIPDEELPVILPLDLGNYKPAGKSPLADHPTFPYYHTADGNTYLRECDTLDTFMCSSFYYVRFVDPQNTKELISKEFADKALPVDFYIGGKEHTYGHLIYSRFIHKFLFDQGVVWCAEPFQKLFHQGMILGPDGRKMSKRRGNVITPEDLVNKYGREMGADTLRTYTMFMWPLEVEKAWNDSAVDGVKRFLDRVSRVMDFVEKWQPDEANNRQTTIQLHKTIKWVTEDIEKLKFNTAVSKLMVFVNHIYDVKYITKAQFATFLQLIAPFATKLTQQLWEQLWQPHNIHISQWPTYDDAYLAEDSMKLPVQINGKMRWTLDIKKWLTEDEIMKIIQEDERFMTHLADQWIKKIIFVQDKIINIIVG